MVSLPRQGGRMMSTCPGLEDSPASSAPLWSTVSQFWLLAKVCKQLAVIDIGRLHCIAPLCDVRAALKELNLSTGII